MVGAGRTELLQVLFGVEPAVSGSVLIDGKRASIASPFDAIECGLALVPEDRKQQGLVLEMAVRPNIGLAGLRRHKRRGGFLNTTQEGRDTAEMIEKLRIKTPSEKQVVQYLSGGNQQKVVIAKWLATRPRVLLLDEPTRGIDIHAKNEIYRLIRELALSGMAILMVSSELPEIMTLSDRIFVLSEGRLTAEVSRAEATEEVLLQAALPGQGDRSQKIGVD